MSDLVKETIEERYEVARRHAVRYVPGMKIHILLDDLMAERGKMKAQLSVQGELIESADEKIARIKEQVRELSAEVGQW